MTAAAWCYPHAPPPACVHQWEQLDLDVYPDDLVDGPWRYFEPFLASRGYDLCWRYYSRAAPETPARHRALSYPVARDPFRPRSREAFVHVQLGDNDDERAGIDQTTGWVTQTATLKMAYDAHDRVVALKALHNVRSRTEIDIVTFLNSPKMRVCPDNHTIPVLETIVTEDWTFLVMPYWPRSVQACIPWEVDDYFNRLEQALEGLSFMHRHGIVHRDISPGNLLINLHLASPGVYTPFSPTSSSPSGIAVAFIDFGCAMQFDGQTPRVGSGKWGTMEHAAPEVPRTRAKGKERVYALPPVDVYALGSVFLRALAWEERYCSTFGNPSGLPTAAHSVLRTCAPGYLKLLTAMTAHDSAARPTAEDALRKCRELRAALRPEVRWAGERGYAAVP